MRLGEDVSLADELDRVGAGLMRRVNADPELLEKGLARLVLTMIDLFRQLMERQAVRQIEAGAVSADETEQLGRTFLALAQRMDELKHEFGLRDEDLRANLGPLEDLYRVAVTG